ncbi:hypothetical protein NG99_04495 [Erwinia typographi]|uniref:Uncharacterized protein n=1 Tax=Erwinia typographi TaxID=371042 RepID=A0A0A3ZBU6_9GAMM|nr:hypothetical protein NG99_04495 [Erwinia typographi]
MQSVYFVAIVLVIFFARLVFIVKDILFAMGIPEVGVFVWLLSMLRNYQVVINRARMELSSVISI